MHSTLRSDFERGKYAFRDSGDRSPEGRLAFGVEEIRRIAWEVSLVTGGVTLDMVILEIEVFMDIVGCFGMFRLGEKEDVMDDE